MMHEFEGILFSNPESFRLITDENTVQKIWLIREQFTSPEHINNSTETAPSKRLRALMPDYRKIADGMIVSKDIGIETIMNQCEHFRKWIEDIKENV